jgi:fatty-acyl-CoA synthase
VGEVVTAVVAVRSPVSAEQLLEHCRSRLAGYKRPRAIRFLDTLPRNPSGKILKRELRP